MNIEEVPQDKKNFLDGDKAPKKVMYVTSKEGRYMQTQSAGWDAENLVLEQAWDDIEFQLGETRKKVLNKELSAIAYFMIKNRMDIPILASYVGKWQWQVKRHLKPSVFNKLSEKLLSKYAEVFEVKVNDLTHFK